MDKTRAGRRGRPLDLARGADILQAALTVLADQGYDGMTVDMVVERAGVGKGTVYRRWPSKYQLVVDAVAEMARTEISSADVPDTGSLRSDLVALTDPRALAQGQRRLKVMAGVAAVLTHHHDAELVRAAHGANSASWVAVNRILIDRAVARGEIEPPRDPQLLAGLVPSLCFARVALDGATLDAAYVTGLIDDVLLPALGAQHPDA